MEPKQHTGRGPGPSVDANGQRSMWPPLTVAFGRPVSRSPCDFHGRAGAPGWLCQGGAMTQKTKIGMETAETSSVVAAVAAPRLQFDGEGAYLNTASSGLPHDVHRRQAEGDTKNQPSASGMPLPARSRGYCRSGHAM